MLSQEADTIDGFTFVWFTDGIGWKSARGNLRETFEAMDTIYSIDDMENGVMEKCLLRRKMEEMNFWRKLIAPIVVVKREKHIYFGLYLLQCLV